MRETASRYYQDSIRQEFLRTEGDVEPAIYLDTGEVSIDQVEIHDASGKPSSVVETGKAMSICIHYTLREPVKDLVFHVGFVTSDMLRITVFNSLDEPFPLANERQGTVISYIPRLPLMPGVYALFVSVTRANNISLFKGDNLAIFQVVDPSFYYIRRNMDLVALDVKWSFRQREKRSIQSKADL
jgi:hypothetical protein